MSNNSNNNKNNFIALFILFLTLYTSTAGMLNSNLNIVIYNSKLGILWRDKRECLKEPGLKLVFKNVQGS